MSDDGRKWKPEPMRPLIGVKPSDDVISRVLAVECPVHRFGPCVTGDDGAMFCAVRIRAAAAALAMPRGEAAESLAPAALRAEVECAVCHRRKSPLGRDVAPAAAGDYCGAECDGYFRDPLPSRYWPGERTAERSEGVTKSVDENAPLRIGAGERFDREMLARGTPRACETCGMAGGNGYFMEPTNFGDQPDGMQKIACPTCTGGR